MNCGDTKNAESAKKKKERNDETNSSFPFASFASLQFSPVCLLFVMKGVGSRGS